MMTLFNIAYFVASPGFGGVFGYMLHVSYMLALTLCLSNCTRTYASLLVQRIFLVGHSSKERRGFYAWPSLLRHCASLRSRLLSLDLLDHPGGKPHCVTATSIREALSLSLSYINTSVCWFLPPSAVRWFDTVIAQQCPIVLMKRNQGTFCCPFTCMKKKS